MRHRKSGRQFGRSTSHRRAMFRALAANLIAHERIETTEAKAKELRRVAERVVTRAKRLGPLAYTPHDKLKPAERAKRLAAQQQVGRFLRRFGTIQKEGETQKIDLIEKVFVDLAQRFKDRPGGYTRILKLGPRRGDNAPMTIIEFVDRQGGSPAKGGKAETKAATQTTSTNAPVEEGASASAEAAPEKAKADATPAAKKDDEKPAAKKANEAAPKKADEKPAAKKADTKAAAKPEKKAAPEKAAVKEKTDDKPKK